MTIADERVAVERAPWVAIAGVIATVSVFAVAQGLTYPLLSFVLERQGISPAMIGLSAAMAPVGFIVSAPLVPVISAYFGPKRTALACACLAAALLALIGWTQDFYAWFVLRFLLGCVINPLYVLSEVWIIALAPPSRRGRIMGIYTTIISAGFAAGPVCLLLVGSQGWPPFVVGICAFVICALCLLSVLPRLPEMKEEEETRKSVSVFGFLPVAWLLVTAVMIAAGFEQAVLSLLPVYGAQHGITEVTMSALMAVLIAGNIAFQIPLGLLAERGSAKAVKFGCVLLAALGCFLLPMAVETIFVWPLVFFWGAASYGIYTMSIIELGERFTGQMLVAGNAAFAMMWGVGGIIVPPATGVAMNVWEHGLPLVLGAIVLSLAVLMAVRWRDA